MTSTDASTTSMDVGLACTTAMEVVEAYATSLEPCELCETFTASVEADTTSSDPYCTHVHISQEIVLLVSFY